MAEPGQEGAVPTADQTQTAEKTISVTPPTADVAVSQQRGGFLGKILAKITGNKGQVETQESQKMDERMASLGQTGQQASGQEDSSAEPVDTSDQQKAA